MAGLESEGGRIELLGSLDLDAWVSVGPDGLEGQGPGPWHASTGTEREVFTAYANELGRRLGRRGGSPEPIWCSWYSMYNDITEASLIEVLTDLGDLPFGVFQIDDGWQQAIGDWDANSRFGDGMADLASRVVANGRVAGLWLAPFLAHESSETAQRYPEMLLRDTADQPIPAAHNWGGTTFALDVTRVDVLDWLTDLVLRVLDWGFRYLKLDFLYAAALPSASIDVSERERAYRAAIETIRKAAGDDVYLLACGAPVVASIGVFDGIRVGPDVGPIWDNEDRTIHLADRSGPGAADAIVTSLSRYWLKGLIDLDPDVVYFRSKACLLDSSQRRLLADLANVCGIRATSDPPAWLDAGERAELAAFLESPRPVVEQIERYSFTVDGRLVDFTPVAEARPW